MTTSPRARWFVALALVGAAAGTAWAWLGVAAGPQGADTRTGGAPPLAEPTLAAGRSAEPEATEEDILAGFQRLARAEQTTDVDELLLRLQAQVEADSTGQKDTIASLASRACEPGDAYRTLLRLAVDRASPLYPVGMRAIVLQLGQCGKEEHLLALVALLRDPSAPPYVRESVALALAQPRGDDAREEGRKGVSIGDVKVSGPIRERFVLDALLETMSEASRDPDARELLEACMKALGASAGDESDVLDALVAVVRRRPERWGTLSFALTLAKPSPRIAAFARSVTVDAARGDGVPGGTILLWMRAEPLEATSYVMGQWESADVAEARKTALLEVVAEFGTVPEAGAPALDRLAFAAAARAKEHPDAVRPAASLAVHAYLSARNPSGSLRTIALDGMITLLGQGWPKDDTMTRALSGFDEPFVLGLLERLRSAAVPEDRLVEVLYATERSPAARGRSAPAVKEAIALVLQRLSEKAREALARRRLGD